MISTIRTLLVRTAIFAVVLGGVDAHAGITGKKTGYFVSVDGTNPAMLDVLLEKNILTSPFGLKWLHTRGAIVERALPGMITITAPSHVSTITCSPPSRHGIVGNSYFLNGEKVSGFDHEFNSEPFWISAKREHKKVLALAYVGADAATERRTSDYSLAYPSDALIGPQQTVELDLAVLADAQNWDTSGVDQALNVLKESEIKIVLNPKTNEIKTVLVLIATNADLSASKIYLDNDKNTGNGVLATLDSLDAAKPSKDLFFTEAHPDSELHGYKRRSFFRYVKTEGQKISVYVSRPSYNNAYPQSFRKSLDDSNMVWPDYGLKLNGLSPAEYVNSQAMIDRFLTDVAVRYVDELAVDVLLFYQPLIDSVGHKLQSALPLPFDPAATDDVTRTFVLAYQAVDQNLSRIFAAANKRRDVFAVMGDHGMDPVEKSVNFARFLPADHLDHVIVHTSGSLTLLYPKTDGQGTADDRLEAARRVGAKTKEVLLAARDGTRTILEMAVERGVGNVDAGTAADYRTEWQYGEAVWAFSTHSGYWFQYRPLDQNIFLSASALGMHGQSLNVPTMATRLVFKAPGVKPHRIANGSLLDAVPTFAELMGMQVPADCVGQSIVKELKRSAQP